MDFVQQKLSVLRTKLDGIAHLQTAEEKTNVPKEYLVVGVSAILGLLVFMAVGIGSLTSIIGFVYPAFKSFLAIETKAKGDDTQWLVYWVIFAFFSIAETFVDYLLYWIPFYYAFKLAFLLWCMLPHFKGAKFLYDHFLKDFLKKNESRIDAALADAKKQAGSMASDAVGSTKEAASSTGKSKDNKKAS